LQLRFGIKKTHYKLAALGLDQEDIINDLWKATEVYANSSLPAESAEWNW
jgi:hypothetical protein